VRGLPPNMRLKLSGLLLDESAVASPGRPWMGGPAPCARKHAPQLKRDPLGSADPPLEDSITPIDSV